MNNADYDFALEYMFADESKLIEDEIPPKRIQRLMRQREMYTMKLHFPSMKDSQITKHFRERMGLSQTQICEDMRIVNYCLGEFNRYTKDYLRFNLIRKAEEAFDVARRNNDPNAMAKVLAALGKFTGLDKEDVVLPDYSQMPTQEFSLSADPEDAGYKRMPNLQRIIHKELMAEKNADIPEAEVVEEKSKQKQW